MFSIIIPTWNNWDFLHQCIQSIIKYTKNYELVIVDNGSEDETVKNLRSLDNLKGQLVINKENKGFAIACNQGARTAKGEILIFLNNDTIVTENWADNMYKCLQEEEKCGIVGAKLIHPVKGTIQHSGVERWYDGTPNHIYFGKDQNYWLANKRLEYFAVTGACLMTPKEIFNKAKCFDERYLNGWEDVAYCNTVKKMGFKIFYEPTAKVYHYESRTSGRYNTENNNFNLYMRDWELCKTKK
jgi:GT2 family glycosyltransferase